MDRPATFAVEYHNGAYWLCLVSGSGVAMLAQFADKDAAARFNATLGHTIAAAHAAGASGI